MLIIDNSYDDACAIGEIVYEWPCQFTFTPNKLQKSLGVKPTEAFLQFYAIVPRFPGFGNQAPSCFGA